jgi:hypothetical protein
MAKKGGKINFNAQAKRIADKSAKLKKTKPTL